VLGSTCRVVQQQLSIRLRRACKCIAPESLHEIYTSFESVESELMP
jgi:hypothetical protein